MNSHDRIDPLDLYVIERRCVDSLESAGEHLGRIEQTVHLLLENDGVDIERCIDEVEDEEGKHIMGSLSSIREIRGPMIFKDAMVDLIHHESYEVVTLGIHEDPRRIHVIEGDYEQFGHVFCDGFDGPILNLCQGIVGLMGDWSIGCERGPKATIDLCQHLYEALISDEGLIPTDTLLGEWLDGWHTTDPIRQDDTYWLELVTELAKERSERYPSSLSPIQTTRFIVETRATRPGDTVALIFGPGWSPYQALELDGAGYPMWVGARELPRGLDLEFKVVVLRRVSPDARARGTSITHSEWVDGEYQVTRLHIDWEVGPNRSLSQHRTGDTIHITSPEFSLG